LIARTARQFPLVIALVVVLALAPIAFAAKGGGGGKPSGGGGGGSSTISLAPLVTDVGTPGLSWGDTITFTVSTTATTEPFVDVKCVQNGVLVYNTSEGFFSWAMNAPYYDFSLSSGMWHSGAANCTAYLQVATNRGWSTLASTSFYASA
jgi:hypothetical protein